VAVTGNPLTTRFVIVELPLQLDAPLQPAVAFEETTPAVITSVNTVRPTFATEADDALVLPAPVVDTLITPAETTPVTVAEAAEFERLPPSLGSGPVPTRLVVMPRTLAERPVASPL
jgi:hypothetical protein